MWAWRSQRLNLELVPILAEAGHGHVLYAPLGVHFPATGEGV